MKVGTMHGRWGLISGIGIGSEDGSAKESKLRKSTRDQVRYTPS